MIKSITVRNHLNKEITLELTRPEKSGLLVTSIEGLGPAKATINVTDISTNDGGVFNSSRLDKRNIVMKLYFLQTDNESIEDIRQKTYVYFPIKKKVYLTIVTDNRTLVTEGYVESNEPDIFSSQESCQISIICPDPLFYSPINETTSFNGVESSFAFPFANNSLVDPLLEMGAIQNKTKQLISYDGNSEIGMNIHIHSLGEARNITIMNNLTDEKMILNTDKLTSILNVELPYPYYCIGANKTLNLNTGGSVKLYDNGDGTLTLRNTYDNVYGYLDRTTPYKLYLTPPSSLYKDGLFRLYDGTYKFTCMSKASEFLSMAIVLRTLDKDRNVIKEYTDKRAGGITFVAGEYVEVCIYINGDTTSTSMKILDYGESIDFIPKFERLDTAGLLAGDTINISTIRGDKSITLLRDGVTTNILNCLERGSKWFTLLKGDNIFSYDAKVGASNLQFYIENKVAYDGV